MMLRTATKKDRGTTMIETIVWIVLFMFIMTAVVVSVLYFYRTNNYEIQQAFAVASAQKGIDKMVRVVREAAYSSQGAFPIVSMSTSSLTMYADVDADPLVEEVHFYIKGTKLYQGVVDPTGDPPVYTGQEATSTLSDYVHNADQGVIAFKYYDKNAAEVTDFTKIGDVRFMTISLIVDVDPNRIPTVLNMRSSATLRNLR